MQRTRNEAPSRLICTSNRIVKPGALATLD
jgi:hypothetical protein